MVARYVAGNYDAWEDVQSLIGTAPDAALQLLIDLLPRLDENERSRISVDILETLLTYHEPFIGPRVLAELRVNPLMREALRWCYLDTSEAYLDQLLLSARTA